MCFHYFSVKGSNTSGHDVHGMHIPHWFNGKNIWEKHRTSETNMSKNIFSEKMDLCIMHYALCTTVVYFCAVVLGNVKSGPILAPIRVFGTPPLSNIDIIAWECHLRRLCTKPLIFYFIPLRGICGLLWCWNS